MVTPVYETDGRGHKMFKHVRSIELNKITSSKTRSTNVKKFLLYCLNRDEFTCAVCQPYLIAGTQRKVDRVRNSTATKRRNAAPKISVGIRIVPQFSLHVHKQDR